MQTGSEEQAPGRPWAAARWWAIALLTAAAIAVLDWLKVRPQLESGARLPYLGWNLGSWMLWVPVVAALSTPVRKLVSTRARPAVLLGAFLGGYLLVDLYMALSLAGLSRVFGPPSLHKLTFWGMFASQLREVLYFVIYLGVVGILSTVELRRRLRQEALTWARLEAELTRAKLDAMRVQLHPQLIDDTLRATAEFVRSGASTQAVQLLARLSDVLRMTLATLGQEKVSLGQELEFLQGYLALQQIRAPGRLHSRVEVAPEALTAEVPSLALFQLAELPASPWEGALELSVAPEEQRLRIRLRQLAPARAQVVEATDRLGRLKERLEHLYPGSHQFRVEHENTGLLCTLEIPLVHLESVEPFATGLRVAAR